MKKFFKLKIKNYKLKLFNLFFLESEILMQNLQKNNEKKNLTDFFFFLTRNNHIFLIDPNVIPLFFI